MKTLRINLAVASIFLIAGFTANAQTNNTKSTSEKKTSETKQIELSKEIPSNIKSNTSISRQSQRPVKVSDYFNMEKKIMSMTIAGDIPASLPKHQEGQTKDEYKLIVRNWAKNNLNLIKEEYHAKILANPKTSNNK